MVEQSASELEISNLKMNPSNSNGKKSTFVVSADGHEIKGDKVEYIFKIDYIPNGVTFSIQDRFSHFRKWQEKLSAKIEDKLSLPKIPGACLGVKEFLPVLIREKVSFKHDKKSIE